MANFTYGPVKLPYSDAVVTVLNDAVDTSPAFYDSGDNPTSAPTPSGGAITFRVAEGTYRLVITRPASPVTVTTRITIPDDGPPLLLSRELSHDAGVSPPPPPPPSGFDPDADPVVIGSLAESNTTGSVAIGKEATADSNGYTGNSDNVAIGTFTQAGGNMVGDKRNIAVGYNANAYNVRATAIGGSSVAEGTYSIAMGESAHAGASYTVAIGSSAASTAGSAVAIGQGSLAEASESVAIGSNTTAAGSASIAIGSGSYAVNSAVAVGQAANASSAENVAVGVAADASASGAVAVGAHAIAQGAFGSTAVGYFARADDSAVAVGVATHADGLNSIGIGNGAHALGADAIAIGISAAGNGAGNTAVGANANAGLSGSQHTVAIGEWSTIDGARNSATAVGFSAAARADHATALGDVSNAAHAHATAVGSDATTTEANQVMLGTTTDYVEVPGNGLVLHASDGSRWRLTISTSGVPSWAAA